MDKKLNFRLIQIEDKKEFEKRISQDTFCENCTGYERVFAVLYCFNELYDYEIATHKEGIYIRFFDGFDHGYFPPIVKEPNEFLPAFFRLRDHVRGEGKKMRLYGLDSVKVSLIKSSKEIMAAFLPSRDNYEYLYRPKNFLDFDSVKANQIKSFEKRYPYIFRDYEPGDFDNVCLLLDKWVKKRDIDEGDYAPMTRALKDFDKLGLLGSVLEVNGKIVGVSIGIILRNVGIVIFEKVDKRYFGASVTLVEEFAKKHFTSVKYINRQEDMGLAGLRASKLSYGPEKFIVKYNMFEL